DRMGERVHPCQTFSAPGNAHVAGDGWPAVAADHEVVPLGLAGNGPTDRLDQGRVVRAGPQRRPQIGGLLVPQAGVRSARAGEADPVAGFAEAVAHRRDEPDAGPGLDNVEVT